MWNLVVVLAENKPGKLAKTADILGKNGIDILMTDIADEGQYGVIRLLTANPEKTRNILYNENVTAALNKVALVEMPDTPGTLAKLMAILAEEKVNVTQVMGCILEKGKRAAFVIIADNDPALTEEKLSKRGVKILEEI
ncbi:MAG: ACT domain-containing protein [Abditibacteriota bacterium]|nr:ACT domain-containing protein [Abditibacteriota bacterium]